MSVLHMLTRFFSPRLRWDRLHRETVVRRRPASLSVLMLENRQAPAVLTVNSLADGPISAADAQLTLREAVALIDTGGLATDAAGNSLAAAKSIQVNTASPFGISDIIQFAPSLFASTQPQIVLADASLQLDRDVVISVPSGSLLAVSGNNESTVFEIVPGAAVGISGVVIEAGAASGSSGGGILNGGTLTLIDSTVTNNTALQGGGILNSGTLTLIDSTVAGNTALNNGGLDNDGNLTLIDSTVSGNTATAANGGLANYGGTLVLINSAVTGNTASVVGGIGNYSGGTATLLDSSVSGNAATIAAGGIYNMATMTLTDSIVSNNVQTNGQGVLNTGELTQIGATVAGNTPIPGCAGGVLNSGTMTLSDSVVSGNKALNDAGIDNSGTLALTASTISGNTAIGGNGGLANYGGSMTVIDSTVSGNTAVGAGGVGNYDGGTMSLLNTTVTGNSAGFAGGILNAANLTLTDGTVADNAALPGSGGGIFNAATLTLVNSTNSGNFGGDLENYGVFAPIETSASANSASVGNGGLASAPTPGNAADSNDTAATAASNAPENASHIIDSVTSARSEITISDNPVLFGSTGRSEFVMPPTLDYGPMLQGDMLTTAGIPFSVATIKNLSADSIRGNRMEATEASAWLTNSVVGSANTDAATNATAQDPRTDLSRTSGVDEVVPGENSANSAADSLPTSLGSEAEWFDLHAIPSFEARWFGVFMLLPFFANGDLTDLKSRGVLRRFGR